MLQFKLNISARGADAALENRRFFIDYINFCPATQEALSSFIVFIEAGGR